MTTKKFKKRNRIKKYNNLKKFKYLKNTNTNKEIFHFF